MAIRVERFCKGNYAPDDDPWVNLQRWSDDLVKDVRSRWMREAQDRSSWRFLEAYIQQWTSSSSSSAY
jgi:hypothetical protein